MRPGDTIHIPAPDKSNHQWTAYNAATVTRIDGDHITARLKSTGEKVITTRAVALTDAELYARLTSGK